VVWERHTCLAHCKTEQTPAATQKKETEEEEKDEQEENRKTNS